MKLRDGVPADQAHLALCEIDEYREDLTPDVPTTVEELGEVEAAMARLGQAAMTPSGSPSSLPPPLPSDAAE
jgi:hypothetical protein